MAKKAKTAKAKKKVVKKTVKKAAKKAALKSAKPKKAKAKKPAKKKKKPAPTAVAEGVAIPPYKCMRTLEPGVCLKFRYNATNGQYDLGGEQVACTTCQYFFE